MKWFANGTLKDLLSNRSVIDEYLLSIAYGIASGMEYLHSLGIMHRDLKPENVLMNDDYTPIIADFGVAKPQSTNVTLAVYGSKGCIFHQLL
jgi:serine/threonine protein kinase